MIPQSVEASAEMFTKQEYMRERALPKPGDSDYLHLSDLMIALKRMETSEPITILDYGAGSSPYRSLFPNSEYRRADIATLTKPDYLIDSNDETIPEKSEVFDMVLSTQTLEHVSHPEAYVSECWRLLKPGGILVLTTHGLFEDHGCPYDFQRWTADGLRRDLTKAAFEVITIDKLTTGPRAIGFLIDRYFEAMHMPVQRLPRLLHGTCKMIVRTCRRRMHILLDRYCLNYRVVSSDAPNNVFYIALLACCRRPL